MNRLGRPDVVAAAHRLIASDGLDALSMRRLAQELGVTPMAIYRHVSSRDDLIAAVIDHAIDAMTRADPALALIDQLRDLDRQLRGAFGDVPDLALLLIRRGPSTPRSVAFIESVVAGFVEAGLSEEEASRTYAALTTLALARVAMPTTSSVAADAYDERPLAAAAARHLSVSDDTTVDLLREVGAALAVLERAATGTSS